MRRTLDMDAHDDLAHLFRQVGAASDSYREFAVPALSDLPDAMPAEPVVMPALPPSAVSALASATPALPRRASPALYGLPDVSPAA
jgi:hypothetical protein